MSLFWKMKTKKEPSKISSPMELAYMKKLRMLLYFLDAWPHRVFGENKKPLPFRSNITLFITWLYVFIAATAYLKQNSGVISFFELGQNYIAVFMNIIGLQRISLPWTKEYKEVTKEFVIKMHLFHHKAKSPYFKKMSDRVDYFCTVLTRVAHAQVCLCTFFFNFTPIVNNYMAGMYGSNRPQNGTYEHAVYYIVPFDINASIYRYIFISCVNIFLVYDCGSCFNIFDLYLSVMVIHIWGHLKILDYNLRNFPHPRGSRGNKNYVGYDSDENIKISTMLVENINHHKLIKDFTEKISKAFGPSLCLYYAFHQITGCILLLECSRLDTPSLFRYGTLTIAMTQQLVQLSVVIEFLGSRNEVLDGAVYSLPWELMSNENQRVVYLFLVNVQVVRGIKAMGIIPVGVRTMAAILKTSLSYFMLLRTFATDV